MPKVVDKQEKKAGILEAAIAVFSKKGLAETTISDIARSAGIGKGTIYEYFESKTDLFISCFRHLMTKAKNTVEQRLSESTDPLDKILAYFQAWNDIFLHDFKDYIEIMLDFWTEGMRLKDGPAPFRFKDIYEENRTMLKDLLDEGIRQNRLRPINTQAAASIILGTLDGLILQWIVDPLDFPFEDNIKSSAQIFLTGLIRRVDASSEAE